MPLMASVAPFVRAVGGEVGQERGSPALQGPPEARDFGDRAGVECREDRLGAASPVGQVLGLVGGALDERTPVARRADAGNMDGGDAIAHEPSPDLQGEEPCIPDREHREAWKFRAYATGEWSMCEIVAGHDPHGLSASPSRNTYARHLAIRRAQTAEPRALRPHPGRRTAGRHTRELNEPYTTSSTSHPEANDVKQTKTACSESLHAVLIRTSKWT